MTDGKNLTFYTCSAEMPDFNAGITVNKTVLKNVDESEEGGSTEEDGSNTGGNTGFSGSTSGGNTNLMTNTVIDGYTIDANGCWTVDGIVQTK